MRAQSRRILVGGLAVALLALAGCQLSPPLPKVDPCNPMVNKVACENSLGGTPKSEWDSGTGDASIQGFATQMSVNDGQTIQFKINTPSTAYHIDIYRLGYYRGDGARKYATIQPTATLPQSQPDCLTDPTTSEVDCGNWSVSASWAVPTGTLSGVFMAHLVRDDTTDQDNQIPFVVRNDSSHSDLIYQTSDTTWEAYNDWGGASLYQGANGKATKVSYNRPFATRADTPNGQDYLMSTEYPMIRFLEENGYDISYQAEADTDRSGSLLLNHKVFLSVGHDEYWSDAQRANVQAARDAGVNLAFFSGNEIYWKTRWEPSIDGSNTSYRTLVCYKETASNAKTDPTSTWTGTWRDPRFSPPADGGRPENALSGTMFTVQTANDAMTVPSQDGKLRFWRNTSMATLSPGTTGTLPTGILGYEWDSDIDNGFRPAGLFDLSSTTLDEPQKLLDYGSTVGPGTATQSMTEYRAPSGALVFSAGTIDWSWGLDATHDGSGPPASPDVQQATVNILADMGAQPGNLLTALHAATRSTDTLAPTATITSPSANASVGNGTALTVTGTATDAGGGIVAAVEISLDGGKTWHRATGTNSWTYTGSMGGTGPETILARASDDSANLQPTPTSVSVNVSCPCSIFGLGQTPFTPSSGDNQAVEVGVKFTSQADGWITDLRFYKGAGNDGTHVGHLWSATGQLLATATFTNETAAGWQQATLSTPVPVTAGTTYVASYYAPDGDYAADNLSNDYASADEGLDEGAGAGPLQALSSAASGGNGVYLYGADAFPTATSGDSNYWVDAVLSTSEPVDTTPPVVTSTTPLDGSSSLPSATTATAVFSEAVQPSTVSFTLTGPGHTSIAGSTSYDPTLHQATFTPLSALGAGTTYEAEVSGAADLAGNVQAPAQTWSFTTAVAPNPPGVCPCSLWNDTTAPTIVTASDPNAVELGVRFYADQDGVINGIRFYKGPQNTGSHTGSLWSSDGQLLATATFTSESTTGWQTVSFASPVPVTAGTTYVASYHTPTGYYSETPDQFTGTGVDTPPLHAEADAGPTAPDGVFAYGASSFPGGDGGGTNYLVDVVFTPNPDTTPPTVTSITPDADTTNVNIGSTVVAEMSEPIQPTSASLALRGPDGAVDGTVRYSTATDGVTFTPSSPLAAATTYTAALSGAVDLAGNAMTDTQTWSFTTAGVDACPCTLFSSTHRPSTLDSNDATAISLGVRFDSDTDGWITGVRFYKAPTNVGVHTATLWDASGNPLATGTLADETSSGWQTLTFDTPVAVTAGTAYVASYYAPSGHYSVDPGFFADAWDNGPLHAPAGDTGAGNGLYSYGGDLFPISTFGSSSYAVDPIFTPTPPSG